MLLDRVQIPPLVDRLRRDPALAGGGEAALEEMIAQVDERVLRDEIGGGLHVGVRQLQAVSHQRRELADDAVHLVEVGRFAFDEQIVPLGADADVEEGLEVLEVLVVGAEQGLDPLSGTVMRFISSILDFQMELTQLFQIDRRRRPSHEIDRIGGLRERDHLANG